MGNKGINIVSIVLTSLFALAAAFFAFQANRIADTANSIAEKQYWLYYETNLPHIAAILEKQCDDASEICYDVLSIQNTGAPIKEPYPRLDILMWIIVDKRVRAKQDVEVIDTYLRLYNYFSQRPLPTGDTQGQIFKPVRADPSEFETISSDFRRAAGEDGYWGDLSLYIYVTVDYEAFYVPGEAEQIRKYFVVDYLGCREKEGREVEERVAVGRDNSLLAADKGLWPAMGGFFDGEQLWEFCKSGLLPKVED